MFFCQSLERWWFLISWDWVSHNVFNLIFIYLTNASRMSEMFTLKEAPSWYGHSTCSIISYGHLHIEVNKCQGEPAVHYSSCLTMHFSVLLSFKLWGDKSLYGHFLNVYGPWEKWYKKVFYWIHVPSGSLYVQTRPVCLSVERRVLASLQQCPKD